MSASLLGGGCSLCQRVAAMTADQQQQFFTIVGIVFGCIALACLLFVTRARRIAGLIYPSEQEAWFGLLRGVNKNYHRIGNFKNEIMERRLEEDKAERMAALRAAGASDEQITREVIQKPREFVGWSLPFIEPFVEILSPRNLKYMLSDQFESFEKGHVFRDSFGEFLGEGIFVADGEKWRHTRKVASHLFSFKKLNDYMFETFATESERLVAYLHSVAKSGETVDFQRLCNECTFDAICKIAFNKELHTIGSKSKHPFCVAFDSAQRISFMRPLTPGWKIARALQLTSAERELRRSMKVVNEFVYAMIAEREANLDEYEHSGDLLSLFLLDARKRGETLTHKQSRDLILSFMLAGRDTTSSALTQMFYLMSQQPDVEAKCVDEVDHVLDRSILPTPEGIAALKYVECTFMESLRLRPVVPVDMKLAMKTCRFPSGEVIPKGTYLVYSPYLVHRLAHWYAQTTTMSEWATDHLEFRPDRWLLPPSEAGEPARVFNPPSHEFIAFNSGPRLCLGKAMAILEGKTLAAAILQTFHLEVPDTFVLEQTPAPVLTMKDGLPVKVHLRKHSKK